MPARRKNTTPVTIFDRWPPGQDIDCLIAPSVGFAAMDLSRSAALRLAKSDPSFPALRLISPRRRAFIASEVVRWIRSRPTRPGLMPKVALDALAASRARKNAH